MTTRVKAAIRYEKGRGSYSITIPPEELYGLEWIDGITDRNFEVVIEINPEDKDNQFRIINENSKPIKGFVYSLRKKEYTLLDGRRRLKNKSVFRAVDANEIAVNAFSRLARGEQVKVNVHEELEKNKEMLKNRYNNLLIGSKTIENMTKDEKRKLRRLEKLTQGYQEYTPQKEAKIIRMIKRRINTQQEKIKNLISKSKDN